MKTLRQNHASRAHAPVSPSGGEKIEICSEFEQRQDEVHPITIQGTKLHEAMEAQSKRGLDKQEQQLYNTALKQRRSLVPSRGWRVFDEMLLKTHEPDCWGTADIVAVRGKLALVCDYKFGFNEVSHPNINFQACAYSLGVFLTYPEVEQVRFSFLYPRMDKIVGHTFFRNMDLSDMQNRITHVVKRKGVKKYSISDNCQYCSKAGTCQVLRKSVAVAGNSLPEATPETFEALDKNQITNYLDMCRHMETFIKQFKRWCNEYVDDIPGYKYVEVSGSRKITDVKAACEIWKRKRHPLIDFYESLTGVSITQLEKKLADKEARLAYSKALVEAGAITQGETRSYWKKEK